jgi:hypothetical protein
LKNFEFKVGSGMIYMADTTIIHVIYVFGLITSLQKTGGEAFNSNIIQHIMELAEIVPILKTKTQSYVQPTDKVNFSLHSKNT